LRRKYTGLMLSTEVINLHIVSGSGTFFKPKNLNRKI